MIGSEVYWFVDVLFGCYIGGCFYYYVGFGDFVDWGGVVVCDGFGGEVEYWFVFVGMGEFEVYYVDVVVGVDEDVVEVEVVMDEVDLVCGLEFVVCFEECIEDFVLGVGLLL